MKKLGLQVKKDDLADFSVVSLLYVGGGGEV